MRDVFVYLHRNKTRLLPIAVVGFLFVFGFIYQEYNRWQKGLSAKALTPTAILSFNQTVIPVAAGNVFNVGVNLDTGNQAITAADIAIKFDQTQLALVNITQVPHPIFKTFMPTVTDSNNVISFDSTQVITQANSGGRIDFSMAAFDATASDSGTASFNGTINPLSILTFQAKPQLTTSTIKFVYDGVGLSTDSNVIATATGGSPEDILMQPISLVIATLAQPTPTPTPLPTGLPGVTPTPAATATPLPTASQLPSVSPSPSASPTPKPSVSPSPSPSGDTQPPTITITNPQNNSTLPKNGSVTVSGKATDLSSISKMEIFIDNALVAICSTASCSYKWYITKLVSGFHTIKVSAWDKSAAQNTASSSITVNKNCNLRLLQYCLF